MSAFTVVYIRPTVKKDRYLFILNLFYDRLYHFVIDESPYCGGLLFYVQNLPPTTA